MSNYSLITVTDTPIQWPAHDDESDWEKWQQGRLAAYSKEAARLEYEYEARRALRIVASV